MGISLFLISLLKSGTHLYSLIIPGFKLRVSAYQAALKSSTEENANSKKHFPRENNFEGAMNFHWPVSFLCCSFEVGDFFPFPYNGLFVETISSTIPHYSLYSSSEILIEMESHFRHGWGRWLKGIKIAFEFVTTYAKDFIRTSCWFTRLCCSDRVAIREKNPRQGSSKGKSQLPLWGRSSDFRPKGRCCVTENQMNPRVGIRTQINKQREQWSKHAHQHNP